MDAQWTLDEVRQQALAALADLGNQRALETLTERTIRYYTTLGLLDPPAGVRGRMGLYGRRHLLQLVAIKRLQAQGTTLPEMQRRQLTRVPTGKLEMTARVGGPVEPCCVAEPTGPYGAGHDRQPRFWTAAPASWKAAPQEAGADGSTAPPLARLVQAVQFARGVTVLFPAPRALAPADLPALQAAAAPLMQELAARGLLAEEEMS